MDQDFLTLINWGGPLCIIQRLKVTCGVLLSNYAFKFNMRRFTKVTFSYDVRWQQSDTLWINRWDAYLNMRGGDDIHWFSILNSLFVTCFLAGAYTRLRFSST